MKKSQSPISSSRSSNTLGGKENKVKETDQFSYRGPVQWKIKTYSPFRGVNLKAAQTLTQAPPSNPTTDAISEQLITKIFGKRMITDDASRFQKKQIPGQSRNVSTVFSQTAEVKKSKSRTPSRVNLSSFKAGFTLDYQHRSFKKLVQGSSGRTTVTISTEEAAQVESQVKSKPCHKRSVSPLSQYSSNVRNPIIGLVKKEEGNEVPLDSRYSQQGKRVFDFKPSKELDNFNKKKNYLMHSEMVPLNQLYKQAAPEGSLAGAFTPIAKKSELNHKRNQSHLDFANKNPRTPDPQRERTPTKRYYDQTKEQGMEMNSILKYKNALPYREDNYMTPKINHVSNLAISKHHMSAMKKGEVPQVASQIKKKEMMSDIGF